MEWNVYRISMNGKGVVAFNIFEHGRFRESCRKTAIKFYNDKDNFTKDMESHLLYYFWAKFEYELFIAPFFSDNDTYNWERKIDIYQQVKLNWNRFVEYVWENREELKKKEY